MQDVSEKAATIELVIFDVDGVLTDGKLILGDDGQEYKAFFSKDGLGMKMLQRSGVEIGIITARKSELVRIRMESLGITHIYQGFEDKAVAFEDLLTKVSFDADRIAYVGDDVVDIPIMSRVGLAIAVEDAHPIVKEHAHWQTAHQGGQGAARDVCELIMKARGTFEQELDRYLKS